MSKKNALKGYQMKYILINEIGEGENAKVFHCKAIDDESRDYALKKLTTKTDEKKARFVDEVTIMAENCDLVEGIIPILDASRDEFWYTMPRAIPIIEYIKVENLDIVQIVKGVIQITETLSFLHNKDISHRDIKPANIYFYNNRYYLGDFGLVDFPDNPHHFTRSDRGLGAIFTIAPEMKRNPKDADGKKADVFSLAKTLWMLLTLDEKGFDGAYDFSDKNYSLRFNDKFKETHLVELEELLYQATQNSPDDRPTIDEFQLQLKNWLKINEDEQLSQLSDWEFLKKYLFRDYTPESTCWTNRDSIVKVLNVIGSIPAYNHMFFSDGGGFDFDQAEVASEKDCIYIYSGLRYVVKPKKLYFEGFNNYEWNYFLLELDELQPILGETDRFYEELVEDYPAHYVSAQYAQYGVYDYDKGNKLPEGAKSVFRYLRGKFLIVFKFGPYNSITATYDGRHGDCNSTQFREYIDHIINTFEQVKADGYNPLEYLNGAFICNPFKAERDMDEIQEIEKKPSPNEYIKTSYQTWCFKDIVDRFSKPHFGNIKFYFLFNKGHTTLDSILGPKRFYLSIDGYIKYLCHDDSQIFYVSRREDAKEIQNLLNERLVNLCELYNTECLLSWASFSTRLIRAGLPVHLFTKEEIKHLMETADDRIANKLVIDENGYAKLIHNPYEGVLYPVSHETWCAGNKYVGKYSNLTDLDDSYISSLHGWLYYLKNGNEVCLYEYSNQLNENNLIRAIKYFLIAELVYGLSQVKSLQYR